MKFNSFLLNEATSSIRQQLESIKNAYKNHGIVDVSMFSNSLIVTSDPEKSYMKMYTEKLEYNKELSDLVGVKLYTGIWL
jgi:hypothetical protein